MIATASRFSGRLDSNLMGARQPGAAAICFPATTRPGFQFERPSTTHMTAVAYPSPVLTILEQPESP